MNKEVIFRLICGIMLVIEGAELGRNLELRHIVYSAEKEGKGRIIYTDIHGKDHRAVVEAI